MENLKKRIPPFLMKFSKLERLEALKSGKIFFGSTSVYQMDLSSHIGDINEGGIPIDPKKPISYNGVTLPQSDSIMKFIQDDSLFLFCASTISLEILEEDVDGNFILKSEFINEMKKFGFDSGKIIYRDLNNFDKCDFKNAYYATGKVIDRYFVKSTDYKNQNEWRIIIGGSKENLKSNNEWRGYSLDIGAFDYGHILECDKLETFKLTPPN